MAAPQRSKSSDSNTALIIMLAAIAAAAAVWAGAAIAAVVNGYSPPRFGVESILRIVSKPADPEAAWGQEMPPAALSWSSTALVLAATAGVGYLGWRLLGQRQRDDVRHLPGTATAAQIRHAASARALLKRGRHLRPSITHPQADDVGHKLGHARGIAVYTSCEDSTVVLGPPRSGKGLHIVVGKILDATGAVITTSTRPDNLTITLKARARTGPVAVFDPQQLAAGVERGLKWSPVRGCQHAQTAMIRARGLASSMGMNSNGGVDDANYWQGQTEAVLRGLLHAAALDGRNAHDLYRWSLDPVRASEAVRVMHNSSRAAPGWADALDAIVAMDDRTRSNIWSGVRQSLAALADPRVLDAVTPHERDQFDPESFVNERGSLYLLGTSTGAGAAASLVNAFIEDMLETVRRVAARSPGARLDPPLSLVLDEIGNLSPLPSLPSLMSEGGGSGINTTAVLQSLAQARGAWGDQQAGTIWDAAIVKLVLGGGSNARDLQDLSALIGERDEETISTSRGNDGSRSSSTNLRRIPIMDGGRLRTLPFGTAVLLLRSAPPIILDMQQWTRRLDAEQLRRDRAELEAAIGAYARR
ncbi:type IV secretory system conjugative DNA transfer family protein [Phytoactinopolyspora alkaliphila]|uniref:Type IV secretory system conjugative DNA transfer family protein n=1 Tax=Phytoactinopolyspora alkaliphila TaxID=1783498 RepID=A0A6N9YPD7_9ACTN|nr:type IV secretory system conjugative DNA transfer family protein [Phytoactinopolyspora alkaliphila]NED96842.1 type IV secretory system conjugative DNA transfer family protein [Phytoactinopolyspora alkaliphila]